MTAISRFDLFVTWVGIIIVLIAFAILASFAVDLFFAALSRLIRTRREKR